MVCPEEEPFLFPDDGIQYHKDDLGNSYTVQEVAKGELIQDIGLGVRGEILLVDKILKPHERPVLKLISKSYSGECEVDEASDWKNVKIDFISNDGRILVRGTRQGGESWRPEDVESARIYSVRNDKAVLDFEISPESGPEGLGRGFESLEFGEIHSPKRGEVFYITMLEDSSKGYGDSSRMYNALYWSSKTIPFDPQIRLPIKVASTVLKAAFLKDGKYHFLITRAGGTDRNRLQVRKSVHILFSLDADESSGELELVKEGIFPMSTAGLFAYDQSGKTIAGAAFLGASQPIKIIAVDTEDLSLKKFRLTLSAGTVLRDLKVSPGASTLALLGTDSRRENWFLSVYDLDHARKTGEVKQILRHSSPQKVQSMVFENDRNVLIASPSLVERISF